jgi:hypothetical protein
MSMVPVLVWGIRWFPGQPDHGHLEACHEKKGQHSGACPGMNAVSVYEDASSMPSKPVASLILVYITLLRGDFLSQEF